MARRRGNPNWGKPEPIGPVIPVVTSFEQAVKEFKLTPDPKQFRQDQGPWETRKVEMLGGQVIQLGGPRMVLDLTARAKDGMGRTATRRAAVTSDPDGVTVLLRLDQAI